MIKEIRELYLKVISWTFLKFKAILWFSFFTWIAFTIIRYFIDNFAIFESVIRATSRMQFTGEVLISSLIFIISTIIAFITSFFGSFYITKKYLKWEPNEEVEKNEIFKIIWVVMIAWLSLWIFSNPIITFILTYLVFFILNKDEVKEQFLDFYKLFISMFTWAILAVLAFAIGFLFSTMIYTIIPFFPLLVLLVIISLIVIFKSFINFYFSLIYKIEDEGRQNSLLYYKIAKKALNWKITLKYVIITLGLYLPWIILIFITDVFSDINAQMGLFFALIYFLFFAYYIEFITVVFYKKYLNNNQK